MEGIGGGELDGDVSFKDGTRLGLRIGEVQGDVEDVGIDGDETEFALVENPAAREFQEL